MGVGSASGCLSPALCAARVVGDAYCDGTAGAVDDTFEHRFMFGSHTSSDAQHSPMLAPAQHVVPDGQQDEPCVCDMAWQQVEPSLQQKAELLAPGPYAPQHVCVELHAVAPL